jgi:hypothetical protein
VENKRARQVRQYILRQIERDQEGLEKLEPRLDWLGRVKRTAETFIPRIVGSAERLLRHVESSLNSPAVVREIWERVREELDDEELVAEMDDALEREERLLAIITGDTVSKLIADFLCVEHPDLAQNNRSTYPDLYFNTADYSALPRRTRGLAVGPALRGGRPTSVPDGVEIKSNRGNRIRVDSHHDHQGLHLALTFDHDGEKWVVHDIYLAYLSKADYTRAERHTTATTDKFSFGHAPFISVTTGKVEAGLLEEATD